MLIQTHRVFCLQLHFALLDKTQFSESWSGKGWMAFIATMSGRPAQFAELSRSDAMNYFLIARMLNFFDICDKSVVFNILRQNVTIFEKGNGYRGRKYKENEEM